TSLLLLLHPPISTLLPYTTLFRSYNDEASINPALSYNFDRHHNYGHHLQKQLTFPQRLEVYIFATKLVKYWILAGKFIDDLAGIKYKTTKKPPTASGMHRSW